MGMEMREGKGEKEKVGREEPALKIKKMVPAPLPFCWQLGRSLIQHSVAT